MFELAVRAKELASSNLNSLIEYASHPVKLLKLLLTELEESVIALTRDAARLERGSGKFTQEAERHDAAAQNWEDKAQLAMDKQPEDLARGALAERNAAREAAEAQRQAAAGARADAAGLRQSITGLEAKHAETRAKLLKVLSEAPHAKPKPAPASNTSARTDQLSERFAALEQRAGYAATGTATLDQELARLADDAALDADLAALRKRAGKKKK